MVSTKIREYCVFLQNHNYISVNCNDPTIRAAVDQQIIDLQNNNPSFFTTKEAEICPSPGKNFQIKMVPLFRL